MYDRIEIDDIFVSENYKTKNNKIITQSGQIHSSSGKSKTIVYEKTENGYEFKQISDKVAFDVPVNSLEQALPTTVILEDAYKMIFNEVIEMHRKLYAVKAKMDAENPDVSLYDYSPIRDGYYVQ